MQMYMIDFLTVAVVDLQAEMFADAQFFSNQLCSLIKQIKCHLRGFVKVLRFRFGNNQEMHVVLGADVGDDDNLVCFMKNLRRNFPIDNFRE